MSAGRCDLKNGSTLLPIDCCGESAANVKAEAPTYSHAHSEGMPSQAKLVRRNGLRLAQVFSGHGVDAIQELLQLPGGLTSRHGLPNTWLSQVDDPPC